MSLAVHTSAEMESRRSVVCGGEGTAEDLRGATSRCLSGWLDGGSSGWMLAP
jgi:hypothetical protein